MNKNTNTADRERLIIQTSIIGIVTNVLLALFKAVFGLLSNSLAIFLDAVNNFTDALSSTITIIGAKYAGRAPDRKHPMGHGRAEYLSALAVSIIIIEAGISAAKNSINLIRDPEEPGYTMAALTVMGVGIIVKIVLGRFVSARGKKTNSSALEASGKDALFDALITFSVLLSAIISIKFGVILEPFMGLALSVVILKSGIEVLGQTLADILGRRPDPEVTKRIKQLLTEEPEVRGAYDLFIYDFGPDRNYCSAHIELPDTMTVEQADVLTRKLSVKVYRETGVIMTALGVYSYNTVDPEIQEIQKKIQSTVLAHDWALQLHAFYCDTAAKTIRFDVVFSFDISHSEGIDTIRRELSELYPDYELTISPDIDVSD